MKNYLALMKEIMETGADRVGRNGATRSLFARQLRWDLQAGFPAVTTKELKFASVVGELLWFLSGSTDNNDLAKWSGKVAGAKTIWTANASDYAKKGKATYEGDLGRIYGQQWRAFRTWREREASPKAKPDSYTKAIAMDYYTTPGPGEDGSGQLVQVDQIAKLVHGLRNDPHSRYHVVTAWNPGDMDAMALPACHMIFQCYVVDGVLSLHMVQRSCDLFLGVPFNIASYALLTHLLAQVCGLQPGELVITFNDVHIYHTHFEAVEEQLKRVPHELPKLWLHPSRKELDEFNPEDIQLVDYKHEPAIKAAMVV